LTNKNGNQHCKHCEHCEHCELDNYQPEYKNRFSVIGAGNLGTYLVHALVRNGFTLKYIYKKSKLLSPLFQNAIENDITKIIHHSDIIFISTQESKINETAAAIADSSNPEGKIFLHTSNSLTSDELISLEKKGAFTASFSPLQTFAAPTEENFINTGENIFNSCHFLLEGSPKAKSTANYIAQKLQAHVLEVNKQDKSYIHIAAVSASNFLVAVMKLADNQFKKINKGNLDILKPLILQTLQNILQNGPDAALTGPVKRKQSHLVQKHQSLLSTTDAALYKALSDYLMTIV
jgi:predicted short-subunit dehydrogenase-like oxidoreductase (DUF2520 family)